MRSLFGELREHISGKGVRIVFPEGKTLTVLLLILKPMKASRK